MNTVQLRYAKRIVPVQYEYEELEVHFGVDADANLISRTEEIKAFVNNALYNRTQPAITPTTSLKGETHGNSQESKQEVVKETSSKKSRSKSSKEEVATSSATEEMEEVESPYKADAPATIPKETKAETKTAVKGKKETAILYDRENPDHRSTMSNFLVKLTGGKEWSKDKERSKKASSELTGQPFLDKAGEILPSFQELCKDKFGVTSDSL